MEFDFLDVHYDLKKVTPKQIEESFEDPFAVKLLPEGYSGDESRYFCLGKSIDSVGIISLFWTDGKAYRVLAAREMTADEAAFYERKLAESI